MQTYTPANVQSISALANKSVSGSRGGSSSSAHAGMTEKFSKEAHANSEATTFKGTIEKLGLFVVLPVIAFIIIIVCVAVCIP